MFVIGTAGHVDHGKSLLVKALTGIDPDRLAEEKERGLTIDLGFAWLDLPSGRNVSIVDVPGHERFIKNMLAGVGGIDLALLIVAADEGVMPQTREHLAILNLLEVKSGILVISKKDLVEDEWLQMVMSDVREAVKDTTLATAPMVAVSALKGDGLPKLLSSIDSLLESTAPKQDIGRPRLSIDRIFTMTGFGTVVTGTLIDGTLSVGQEIEIVPRGIKARIRGLQMHKTKADSVGPGNRVAVNLAGLSVTDFSRGEVLTVPGWLKPTRRLDVKLRTVPNLARAVKHNTKVTFHTGSCESPAKVRLLESDKLGADEVMWAQVRLEKPVVLVKGDFFIVRASWGTLGGGRVIDPYSRRHRRLHKPTLDSLEALEQGGAHEVLLKLLVSGNGLETDQLIARSGLASDQVTLAITDMQSDGRVMVLGQTLVFSSPGWKRFAGEVRGIVGQYHLQYPLRLGIPREDVKSRLKMTSKAISSAVPQLVLDNVVVDEGASLRLPDHRIELSDVQRKAADSFLKLLAANPYSPALDVLPDPALLNLLVDQKKVVRVSANVVFSTDAYDQMVSKVIACMKENGKITVAVVRDMFNASRKYALALMEHMDERKITRRVGDERVLRAGQ
ncbi:MAG: selenocysteine-specific translation elongation factor [Chloroflexi bacterium]|jgi:selenocysteine-specific elongation factor|nr:selenocysteine-specific translation elongation factor [Chloroflexota bacterium]MBT7082461.1 selenocysteine-specific translation elongation factor [Chloroflexota bacterium]MBT7290044.1 selenocysteine-specific translation elongation factor [Chloroflexota bacterium]